jgi:hypothetical protein
MMSPAFAVCINWLGVSTRLGGAIDRCCKIKNKQFSVDPGKFRTVPCKSIHFPKVVNAATLRKTKQMGQ